MVLESLSYNICWPKFQLILSLLHSILLWKWNLNNWYKKITKKDQTNGDLHSWSCWGPQQVWPYGNTPSSPSPLSVGLFVPVRTRAHIYSNYWSETTIWHYFILIVLFPLKLFHNHNEHWALVCQCMNILYIFIYIYSWQWRCSESITNTWRSSCTQTTIRQAV